MTQIYDLSDPAQPVFIRDFGLPGQQPGATGPVPTELHGAISTGRKGNRVYFGYGTNAERHRADRRSREAAERPEGADRREPALSRRSAGSICRPINGAHTAFPVLGMDDRRVRQGQGRQACATSSSITDESDRRTSATRRGRWCGSSTSPTENRSRSASRPGRCPRRAATSAAAAAASARIRRTRT